MMDDLALICVVSLIDKNSDICYNIRKNIGNSSYKLHLVEIGSYVKQIKMVKRETWELVIKVDKDNSHIRSPSNKSRIKETLYTLLGIPRYEVDAMDIVIIGVEYEEVMVTTSE